MSKKFFIILISVVLGLSLISLVGYYLILKNKEDPTGTVATTFKNFFPFGGSDSSENVFVEEVVATSTREQTQSQQNYDVKLRKLSSEAVAGAGIIDAKAGTIVRYIEKATGHIYETELFSVNHSRISNTTIPMVYDALWGNKNNSIIARYLKTDNQSIDTYGLLVKETSTTTTNTVTAVKLAENLSEVAVLGDSVFTLQRNADYSSGFISKFDGSKRVQIWSSPLKELLPQYVNGKTIALNTKPHQDFPGYLFFVDTGNAKVTKVLGNISGLSTLVNDIATQVLTLDQQSDLQLYLFDIKNASFKPLSPTTFPEKCVWSKKDKNIVYCAVPQQYINNKSLTSWYQGFVSYADSIWKYDLKNNTSSQVNDLFVESNERIDVVNPLLSESEKYVVFINKIDGSLWSLDLLK